MPNCTFRTERYPDVNHEKVNFVDSTQRKKYTVAGQLPYLRKEKKLVNGQLVNIVSELLTSTTTTKEIITTSNKPTIGKDW